MALQDYFVWGSGGQKKTPDQIARERKIAEAMIASGVDTSPVGHWTQGAARMANALVGNIKQGRADAAEKAGIEGATNKFNSLDLAKILSGGQAAYPSSVAAGASPTSAAATNTPVSIPKAPEIRQGLVDRGLPEHVADAFVLNFQDESGLNPAINERNPLVAGSRGGYGLYQLTGPRRREYEAFASQRGVAPSDTNAQLDFLMHELQGSEAKAARNILGSSDTATAAQAIVNDFLRPAESHRASRAARYATVANTAPETAADAINMIAPPEPQGISQDQFNSRFNGAPVAQPVQPQTMQQPDPMPTGTIPQAPQPQFSDSAIKQHDAMFGGALAPAGTTPQQAPVGQGYFPEAPVMGSYASMAPQPQQGGNQLQELMAAASDPFLNDSQRGMINMALQQQMQNADPMRQMQMQKLQQDIARGGQTSDWSKLDDNRLYNQRTGELRELPVNPNANVGDLGLNPQYGTDANGNPVLLQLGKNGQVVQSKMPDGVTLSKEPIKLDAGTHFVLLDPITRQPVGQIAKDVAGAAAAGAGGKAQGEAASNLPVVESNANSILGMIDSLDSDPYLENMLGSVNSRLPNFSSNAARVQSKMDQIGGQAFLQAFNSLKGGGQITEVEGQKATEAIARLNTAQSPADYRQALNELRTIVKLGVARARQQASGATAPAANTQPSGVNINGYSIKKVQ